MPYKLTHGERRTVDGLDIIGLAPLPVSTGRQHDGRRWIFYSTNSIYISTTPKQKIQAIEKWCLA